MLIEHGKKVNGNVVFDYRNSQSTAYTSGRLKSQKAVTSAVRRYDYDYEYDYDEYDEWSNYEPVPIRDSETYGKFETTDFTYNTRNQRVNEYQTKQTYWEDENRIQVTHNRHLHQQHIYDANGRVLQVIDKYTSGKTSSVSFSYYNSAGQLASQSTTKYNYTGVTVDSKYFTSYASVSGVGYDAAGNLKGYKLTSYKKGGTRVDYTQTHKLTYGYNAQGYQKTRVAVDISVDGYKEGQSTFTYNGFGELNKVIRDKARNEKETKTFHYNANSQILLNTTVVNNNTSKTAYAGNYFIGDQKAGSSIQGFAPQLQRDGGDAPGRYTI